MLSKIYKDPKQQFSIDDLFKANLEGYNAIIHLNPSVVQKCLSSELEDAKPEKGEGAFVKRPEKIKLPIAGYYPITRVLQDLRV